MLEKLDEIKENIFKYVEARIELFKLETRNKVEDGAVQVIHGIVLGFLATMTTFFLFSLVAAYLNEVLNSCYLGFLIILIFFLLLTLVWILAKVPIHKMLRKIAYSMIKSHQEKRDEEKSRADQVQDSFSSNTHN